MLLHSPTHAPVEFYNDCEGGAELHMASAVDAIAAGALCLAQPQRGVSHRSGNCSRGVVEDEAASIVVSTVMAVIP